MSSLDPKDASQPKRPFSSAGSSDSAEKPEPAASEKTKSPPWKSLLFFATRGNVPLLTLGIVMSILGGLASPAQNFITGKVFEGFTSLAAGSLAKEDLFQYERKYIVAMVGVAASSWIFHAIEFMAWIAFGELQAKNARDRLFHGLLEKDIEWYDLRKNGIAALLPRIQTQIKDLQLATSQPFGATFSLTTTAVVSLAQAFYFSWDLTLVTMSSVPVIMALVTWIGAGIQPNLDGQNARLTEAQKFASSAFSAIETVKCYNGQEIELRKFTVKAREAATFYYRVASRNALQMAFIGIMSSALFVQGFYYGGVLIDKGKKNAGDVITCFLSATGAFSAISGIMPQVLVLEKGRSAGSTLRAIMTQMKQTTNVRQTSGTQKPMHCKGDIGVKNVSFAYPSRTSHLALDNVTMFIPGRELTFLIGKSGSGKSTISQLLMRFYNYEHGSISLDGVSLEDLDTNWLRSNVTLVEQTSLLFNDTLFRNIAFGRRDHENVTREEVMDAVQFALLQLMITEMPDGLDTLVGYKGGTMSGGQRQRMALARARVRDTPILILDESTSALDQISRALMMDAIRQWRRGKTTIIITHDISQILGDDYAFVLQQGRVVQEGYRKHMEKLKDSAFQDFLLPEQRACISPFDARKHTGFDSIRTRDSSLDSVGHAAPTDLLTDPVEDQLDAGTKGDRRSFLPPIFLDGSVLPGARPFNKNVPSSTIASSFLRIAVSPPQSLNFNLPWFSPAESPKEVPDEGLERLQTNDSKRWTQVLEKLVDRTGKAVADARTTQRKNVHRRGVPVETQRAGLSEYARLTVDKESHEDQPRSQQTYKQIYGTLWSTIDHFPRFTLLLGLLATTIHAAVAPASSYVLSNLIKTYTIAAGRQQKSLMYSMIMLGLAFVDALNNYLYRFCLEYTGQCWVDQLREEALKRILNQPRAFFDKEENSISRMAEALDRNAEEMRNLLARFAAMILMAAIMAVMGVVWAIALQWKLTLIALCVAPYIYLVTNLYSAVSDKWEAICNNASEAASAIFTETFTNIKTVRALTLERHFEQKYLEATNYALRVGFLRALYSGFLYGVSDSAGNFSTALIVFIGTKLAGNGAPATNIIQVFTMLIMTITSVGSILVFIPQVGSAKDNASRLLRFAQLPEVSHEHAGDTRIVSIGDIQLSDLRFAYPSRPELTILNNINLLIQPGTSTAIVGGSGSGKSTIANLLLNLYPTNKVPSRAPGKLGDLTLAGRDIKHIQTPSLRALIVVVSQTPVIFAATVGENISYGLTEKSPYNNIDAITSAAKQAGIHDFIKSLTLGYSTLIGEGGMGLSGGQAQRIAIARALVRNPSVLILDEATSALDVESATTIRNTIREILERKKGSMTVIIITHNREMMDFAERVVVLDQGSITEEGGFEELLAKKGALFNLLSGGEWDVERESESQRQGQRSSRRVPRMKDINWQKKAAGKSRLQL